MFPRSLTHAQRQKLTNSLFWTCAVGAIFTVALPSILPCPAIKSRQSGLVYADGQESDSQKRDGTACRDTRTVLIEKRTEHTQNSKQ